MNFHEFREIVRSINDMPRVANRKNDRVTSQLHNRGANKISRFISSRNNITSDFIACLANLRNSLEYEAE